MSPASQEAQRLDITGAESVSTARARRLGSTLQRLARELAESRAEVMQLRRERARLEAELAQLRAANGAAQTNGRPPRQADPEPGPAGTGSVTPGRSENNAVEAYVRGRLYGGRRSVRRAGSPQHRE